MEHINWLCCCLVRYSIVILFFLSLFSRLCCTTVTH